MPTHHDTDSHWLRTNPKAFIRLALPVAVVALVISFQTTPVRAEAFSTRAEFENAFAGAPAYVDPQRIVAEIAVDDQLLGFGDLEAAILPPGPFADPVEGGLSTSSLFATEIDSLDAS